MRFKKISITKRGVDLTRETKGANGAVEEVHLSSPERPLGTFADALQAFGSYVNDLLEVPEAWRDKLTVTTVHLHEDKNGRQGLQVSVVYAVAKADDKVVSLTTPIVFEASDAGASTSFHLADKHFELIELLESEATRYAKGERVQGELFEKKEPGVAEQSFNDRSAAAEVASTRKPKGKGKATTGKVAGHIPGVGDVVNVEKTEPPTDENLRKLLLQAEREVPLDAIAQWTSLERDAAQRWAGSVVSLRFGSIKQEDVPAEPECVLHDATPGLTWDQPPQISPDAVQEIRAAAEGGR